MSEYTKDFVLDFGRYTRRVSGEVGHLLHEFIAERDKASQLIPIESLFRAVMTYYYTTENLIFSSKKYGNLPLARVMMVFVALREGYKSVDVIKYTGWVQPRVAFLKKTAEEAWENDESFRNDYEEILMLIQK